MPITIIIGAQWGDEGKGRVVDWLAASADIVARYAGGDNAGHTVALDGDVYKLHLVPSGILHGNVVSVMGNGMVINPVNLVQEINALRKLGLTITPERLVISARAHIITPGHIALDKAKETSLGDAKIGTTLRGIGPAYLDKTGRAGIRTGDMLLDVEEFADRLVAGIEATNTELGRQGMETLDAREAAQEYLEAAAFLKPFIKDVTIFLDRALKAGLNVVCEGAQGTMLDVDHGSYPFVTSSSPTAGGALTGLGVGPCLLRKFWAWPKPSVRVSAAARCQPSWTVSWRSACAAAAQTSGMNSARRPAGRGAAAGWMWRCCATRPASTA